MESAIREFLQKECDKQIRRHGEEISRIKINEKRLKHRTGISPTAAIDFRPDHWSYHYHFDPYHVRSKIDWITKGIVKSFGRATYKVSPAYKFKIPKDTGGFRDITIFTLPDSAVANFFFNRLREKNLKYFSAYSFAYRRDRSRHMAIEHLERVVKSNNRLYLLEYDFKNYFDSISHDYLNIILKTELNANLLDRTVINSFLKYPHASSEQQYKSKNFTENQHGIPLGSQLSSFLANVACLEIDRELEGTGCVFARFADDTAVLCQRYDQVNDCAKIMLSHKARAGVEVNYKKSPGISLLSLEEHAELKTVVSSFDFVGYKIGFDGVSIRSKSIEKIKKTIAKIIYRHLLLYPRKPKNGFYSNFSVAQFNTKRIRRNGDDVDLLYCIYSLRRYIYGSNSETEITSCVKSNYKIPRKTYDGILSRYPMVNNPEILFELDGWLVDVVRRAMRERHKILSGGWPAIRNSLRKYTRNEILNGKWYKSKMNPPDTRMPSFYRAWVYTRMQVNAFGLDAFKSDYYV